VGTPFFPDIPLEDQLGVYVVAETENGFRSLVSGVRIEGLWSRGSEYSFGQNADCVLSQRTTSPLVLTAHEQPLPQERAGRYSDMLPVEWLLRSVCSRSSECLPRDHQAQ
jgi:hypothetical protein